MKMAKAFVALLIVMMVGFVAFATEPEGFFDTGSSTSSSTLLLEATTTQGSFTQNLELEANTNTSNVETAENPATTNTTGATDPSGITIETPKAIETLEETETTSTTESTNTSETVETTDIANVTIIQTDETQTDGIQTTKGQTIDAQSLNSQVSFTQDTLLLSDIPIIYGEEKFLERIKEKTGGEREPIGLVLSGGSARAFAHIGVLQYLEEQGIYPDYIVSNSMGSIVALLYGAGMSPAQILEVVTSTNFGDLFEFSLPINTGLLDISKFKSLIGAYVGEDLKVEDLAIPVMVVCEDLTTKRQVLITEGSFLDVLSASFALPIYFGSVEYKDNTLVDGGIANIAPIEVAYKYSNNVIVSTTFYAGKDLNEKNPITGLNISIDIGKRRQGVVELKAHPEAIWVRCNVEDFSFMDFKLSQSLAQHGYDSCLENSEQIAQFAKIYKGEKTSIIKAHTTDLSSSGETLEEDIEKAEENTTNITNSSNEITATANASFLKKLERKRVSFTSRMPKVKRSYDIYNRSKTIGATTSFGFTLKTYENSNYMLRDDFVFGLNYGLSAGNLNVKISAGVATKLQSYGYDTYQENKLFYQHVMPTVDVSIDYYLGSHIKASVDGAVSFTKHNQNKICALYFDVLQSLMFRSNSFAIGSIPGKFTFSLVQSFELIAPGNGTLDVHYDLNFPLLTGRAIFDYSSDMVATNIKAGVQHIGWIGKDSSRLFGVASLDFGVNITKEILLEIGTTSRFSFDGKGNIPIFSKDGFVLAMESLESQGTVKSTSDNTQQYIIATSIALDYMFQKDSFGIAEILLISNSSIGAFCNLLWNDGAKPHVQVGAKASTVLGFIGLKDAPLSCEVLYDFSMKKFLWRLSFKSSF